MSFINGVKHFKVTGRVRPNSVGNEIICFRVRIGFIQIDFVVNIPCEGTNEAPVYVRARIASDTPNKRDDDNDFDPKEVEIEHINSASN